MGTTSLSDNRFPHREITSGFVGNQDEELCDIVITFKQLLCRTLYLVRQKFFKSQSEKHCHPKKRKVLNLATWILERKRRLLKKNKFIVGFSYFPVLKRKCLGTQAGFLLLLSTTGRCPEISLHIFVKFSPMLPYPFRIEFSDSSR